MQLTRLQGTWSAALRAVDIEAAQYAACGGRNPWLRSRQPESNDLEGGAKTTFIRAALGTSGRGREEGRVASAWEWERRRGEGGREEWWVGGWGEAGVLWSGCVADWS